MRLKVVFSPVGRSVARRKKTPMTQAEKADAQNRRAMWKTAARCGSWSNCSKRYGWPVSSDRSSWRRPAGEQLCGALLAIVAARAAADTTIMTRVVRVHDGDTITALTDDNRQLIRKLLIFILLPPQQHRGNVLQTCL